MNILKVLNNLSAIIHHQTLFSKYSVSIDGVGKSIGFVTSYQNNMYEGHVEYL